MNELIYQILMPLVTSDPDDLNRLAWYKLIQTLIEKATPGLDQILLLEQVRFSFLSSIRAKLM
jgi:hypothetical protein